MGALFRKLATLVCFLLVVGVLVASASKTADQWILIVAWSAFLAGSVVLVIKNLRQPRDNRGSYFGQLALLPRSWQRWILGEQKAGKSPEDPSRGK